MMKFIGIYKKIIKRNFRTGEAVFAVETNEELEKNEYDNILCRGVIHDIYPETPVEIHGEMQDDIFQVSSIKETTADKALLISFLASGKYKNIGMVTAENILAVTGNDIYQFAETENAEKILSEKVPRLSLNTAMDLILSLRTTISQRSIYHYLSKYAVAFSDIRNLVETSKTEN